MGRMMVKVTCIYCGETKIVKHNGVADRKYCGQKCFRLDTKINKTCRVCEAKIQSSRTYCDECMVGGNSKFKIKQWLSGEWSGGTSRKLSNTIRNYLLKINDYKCSKCGYDKTHPDDGNTILEINHINGDGSDHSLENLEVICPNCHALTSSYRARNMGKGRQFYYVRVNK